MTTHSFRPHWTTWLGLSVMDRYIVKELILPFLFGVGAFSSLGLSIGALFELIRKVTESGLSVGLALQVLALKFPQFIAYAFPTSMLLATMTTYSRFSSDSELVALKACGVSIYRMIAPALALCLVVTGLTFAFNELIVPAANYRATMTMQAALNERDKPFQERNILYQEFKPASKRKGDRAPSKDLNRLFYAKEFDGQQMNALTILDFSQSGLSQIVSAKSAQWSEASQTWDFKDGTIYAVSPDGSFKNILKFEDHRLNLPRTPLDLASRKRDYDEMNIAQSLENLELIQQTGDDDAIQKLKVRIQQKYALPFVCVMFGLVGAAVGSRFERTTGRATGFAVSILLVFAYYLLAFISGALAQRFVISPFLGGWLPNFAGILAAIALIVRSAK
jgi:lipopolysaccharide export system permease protein